MSTCIGSGEGGTARVGALIHDGPNRAAAVPRHAPSVAVDGQYLRPTHTEATYRQAAPKMRPPA